MSTCHALLVATTSHVSRRCLFVFVSAPRGQAEKVVAPKILVRPLPPPAAPCRPRAERFRIISASPYPAAPPHGRSGRRRRIESRGTGPPALMTRSEGVRSVLKLLALGGSRSAGTNATRPTAKTNWRTSAPPARVFAAGSARFQTLQPERCSR